MLADDLENVFALDAADGALDVDLGADEDSTPKLGIEASPDRAEADGALETEREGAGEVRAL